ncbi:hypothetical protein [Absidia glauca]|uniref:serine C-palmitoyltransferase n=1 Tax=Absidia glauca TaxID=4829 RepID=A0A168QWH1_ABSGL|nr:hypothetical protein [Absidia glauca]
MGKGKRAHTISIPSIPSISLTTPKSSSDHSFSVSPSAFLQKHSSSASTTTTSNTNNSTSNLKQQWSPPSKARRYDDLEHKLEVAPLYVLVSTYLNYFVLILFGHLRDIMGKFFKPHAYSHLKMNQLLERVSYDFNRTFRLTGKVTENLNFASYNYLGFAQSTGPCADAVEQSTLANGIASPSPRAEAGSTLLHAELERQVARFVGKPDAMVVSMGFATNSTTIPALVSKGCLIISDEMNHSSIVFGARLSGAAVRVFKHNNMDDLKDLLREVISQGQPRTHRPWKKILVIVEGLYSMEGTVVNLPEIVQLKKEFKFYLYVDEAHSIGALGENGGGVCDFFGVDPANIDILMGTFTKSFGAAGGYIAADKAVIDHLRIHNHGYIYAEPMSVPVAQQVMTSMKIICGEDGTDDGRLRIKRLAENSLHFTARLRALGFIVYGDHGSPVVPLLLFNPAKIPAFSRELLKRGIAVCVVGYPATPIITSRARFCLSASHTKEDIDRAVETISEVGDLLMLKVSQEAK